MEQKDCVQCGTPFFGASNKIYCSNTCKQMAFKEKHQHLPTILENDLPTIAKKDAVWFMDLCLAYHQGKRLLKTELETVLAQFETVLEPFYAIDKRFQKPYLEVCDEVDNNISELLCDIWCVRDVLQANLEGILGRHWKNTEANTIHHIDFDGLPTFGIIQNTFKALKTYLN